VAEIPGIERIATPPATPTSSRLALIAAYDGCPNWSATFTCRCSTAQTAILMAMKRGYTAMEYKSTVRKLRAIRPDMAMSSDFIVGFPGGDGGRLQQDDEADRRGRLRQLLQLHLQPTPRHTRSQSARRHAA